MLTGALHLILIVKYVVYEADEIRAAGGKIIRVVRPDFEGPSGMMTDQAEAGIVADIELVNDGDVSDLLRKVDELFNPAPDVRRAA